MASQLAKYEDLQTNIKFLKLIEKHECLWKHDSPYYTNNNVKVKAWKEIATAINATEERCSRRWRYIRQAYSQYVRASYRTDQTKSKYYLSPHVDFVRPYVKLPYCHSNDSHTDQNKGAERLENQKETIVETEKLLEKQFLELIEGTSENYTKTDSLKRKVEINASAPKAKYSKINPDKNIASKNWMFLESILPFVDEMSKKQIRRFRRKAMILLDDILKNKQID